MCLLLLLLALSSSLSGCGPKKTPETTLTPRELKTDAERLSLVRFSLDGQQLGVGGADGEVLVWRELNDPPLKLESGHASPLMSLTWSPDRLLAATDLDRNLTGWQFGKSEPVRVDRPGLSSPAVCLAFRPNAAALEMVLGMRDGSLIFVNPKGTLQIKPDHRGPVKQALYSLDGNWLITAGADGQLIWRNASSRAVVQAVKAHDAEISRLLLSLDGKQVVSGDWNGGLKLWDMTTRKSTKEFVQPEAVSGLGWVRNELVSGSWDGALRGWNLTTGRCVRTIPTGQPIHDLACDPRTPRVVTVSLNRLVRVWDWPDSTSR